MLNKLRQSFSALILIAVIVFLIILSSTRLYTDWLWFQALDYQSVFLTIILSDYGLRLAASVTFFVLLLINLLLTRGPLLKATQKAAVFREEGLLTIQMSPLNKLLTLRFLTIAYFLLSLVMAFLFSFSIKGDWVLLQKFLHPTYFGVLDPVFQHDIGFYVFKFPFYQFLYNLANWTILITAFWVAAIYLLVSVAQGNPGNLLQSISARYHLSILAALFFLLKAVGYQLEKYLLLFTHNGAVWGLGYTATHTTLIAYKVLTYIAVFCALAILVNLFLRRFKLVVYSIGFLVLASVLLGGVYPGLVQRFIVTPNEITLETPYLARNIEFTRNAYNLDKIEKRDFPAGRVLALEDIQANQDTITNIRLWDWEPLQQTYAQLQEMRLYYHFKEIDIDRYVIDGHYRQVMLAARELNQEHLSSTAKTWINQRLIYTHGYGIAMSPVNEHTAEGLPTFFLKDIPPASTTDLEVTRPEVYYGEVTDNYVIVNTKTKEFDYPQGDDNAYTTYEGDGGVKLSSFLRRLMFAFSVGDYKLLLASDIDNNSKILYYRNIDQRVHKIAPFLDYDSDPYIVLSEGKLYWLWDAYTTTDKYPYSEPYNRINNYIRNSVKVVVDAYTGDVDFYVSDTEDPLVMTYSKIFPGMFKSLEEMPEDLRHHIRYPLDYFTIQANMYAVYHMQDPQVFYNKEDKWNIPKDTFNVEQKMMEPYYTIIKLPGENKPEFVLILPFTPQNKNNMIAWMAARSDGEEYGKLLTYSFPKQELVYGPSNIEARINQDTTISQQVSLWDQRGSRVIRGNLLAIPIKDALLYVVPLYLQSEQSRMPELRRVIVAHGDMVIMEPTLGIALEKIFGKGGDVQRPIATAEQTDQPPSSMAELAQKANQLYDEAQNKLKAGDWSGYGETLSRLKETLSEMAQNANQ
ncbi:MAG: UPF0182 family protein [Desulfotomaculaceae bacterium]|nr:UPF0182 family protein [Desulfotomaculaceae bacterium]